LIGLSGLISCVNLLAETEVWHAQAWGKLIGTTLMILLGAFLAYRGSRNRTK